MSPVSLPSAGLHYGVSFEDYTSWPAANFSKIKPILDTASKCKWEMDHPKQTTPAMKLGSAMHVAVLEPARFEGLFFIAPYYDGRTKEGKEIKAKAEQDARGKLIIRTGSTDDEGLMGEVERLRGMGNSVRAFKPAAKFIDQAGQNEVSALWKDPETGLWCKARWDRYLSEYKGSPTITEFKTCRSAAEWHFAKDVDNLQYDAQAAGYRFGHQIITGKEAAHVFVAVESTPPFDVAVHMLDGKSLQTGLLKYRQMLSRFAECMKSGKWPGYPEKVNVIETPGYAHTRDYND